MTEPDIVSRRRAHIRKNHVMEDVNLADDIVTAGQEIARLTENNEQIQQVCKAYADEIDERAAEDGRLWDALVKVAAQCGYSRDPGESDFDFIQRAILAAGAA